MKIKKKKPGRKRKISTDIFKKRKLYFKKKNQKYSSVKSDVENQIWKL